MRFDVDCERKPNFHEFDVLIVDTVGVEFNAFYPEMKGMGGTEFQIVMLAEGLANSGYRVGVINRGPFASKSPAGVKYFPVGDLVRGVIEPKTEVLISMRSGILPPGIEFNKIFFWIHDIPDSNLRGVHDLLAKMPDAKVICVSEWQRSQCPNGWAERSSVVHNIIPDWIYEVRHEPTVKNYVYLSAAQKGLDATLEVWNNLQKSWKPSRKSLLQISVPGYDSPDEKAIKKSQNVMFLGSFPIWRVVQMLKESIGGVFYANTKPETFGLVPAMAEVIGTPLHVLCLNGTGALEEVLNGPVATKLSDFEKTLQEPWKRVAPKDFRMTTQLPKWIETLELKEKAE